MQAIERQAGEVMIEADLLVPAIDLVTAIALLAQVAAVDIVCLVTVNAVTHRRIFFYATGVAGIAGRIGVRAAQREFGLFVMIETVLAPAVAVVAILAAFAITLFVDVIGAVTAKAGAGEFIGCLAGLVTGRTGGIFMRTFQPEIGFVMIVPGFFPFLAVVTAIAFVAIALEVDIVTAMTGDAFFGCLLVVAAGMAGDAANLDVRAL